MQLGEVARSAACVPTDGWRKSYSSSKVPVNVARLNSLLDCVFLLERERLSNLAIECHVDFVVERIIAALIDVMHDAER